jgi:hypothetical protein
VEGRQPSLGVLGEDERVRRPTTGTVAGLAAGLVFAVGCTSGSSDPEPSPSTPAGSSAVAAPPPARPKPGSCHRLTYDAALAPTSDERAVDCAKRHSSQTYAVGRLATERDGHLLAVDSSAVQEQVAARCPTRLGSYVGATDEQLRLTMLRAVWFTPTVEESDAGANWFRCDVIAVAAEDRLAQVKGTLKGALGSPDGRTSYAMCGTAQPGTPGFERLLCSEEHTWRAIRSVTLKGRGPGDAYPGEDAVREAGQSPCTEAAREVADDALDYEWGYEWPTPEQWAAGQTFGRCWAPESS